MKKVEISPPNFTIHDVRYATDEAIIMRAEGLIEQGKVKLQHCDERGYSATVEGSSPYHVYVSATNIERGSCDCYMGERDEFCKHFLAVALLVLEMTTGKTPIEMTEADAKKQISAGVRKFTAYHGPSSVWFSYQRRLDTGTGIVSEALPFIPETKDSITYLWKLVVRLSRKLAVSGIDDSNGTVGGCVGKIIERIGIIAQADEKLLGYAQSYCKDDTGFGFEDELGVLLKNLK